MKKELKLKFGNLPEKPGVYQFFDSNKKIIYIGKAKNLRKRVSSYFQKKTESPKTTKLKENICDLKFIETETETEALILESNLIKEKKPRYNILLRDDKHYVYIRIDLNKDFPAVRTVRKVEKDKASYFGPKTSASSVRDILKLLRKSFPYRNCKMQLKEKENRIEIKYPDRRTPCLDHHIHLCPGCCVNKISSEEYKENIQAIAAFLKGDEKEIVNKLKKEMAECAMQKKFERAARIRDRLFAIEKISEKQRVDGADFSSRDIVGFFSEGKKHFFNLFIVREGKLIDQINVTLSGEDETSEILKAFLMQYYSENNNIPKEILLPEKIEEKGIFEEWLKYLSGSSVKILFPQKGEKSHLIKLAEKNAEAYALQQRASFEASEPLKELQEILKTKKEPKRIECYDISHSSGEHTVGSMTVFVNGKPAPNLYRKFTLRSLKKGEVDDYLSLSEVLKRRMFYLTPQLPKEIRLRKILKKDKLPKEIKEKEERKEYLVAATKKEIVGGVKISEIEKSKIAVLENLFVKDKYKGINLGKELVRTILEKSKLKKVYTCAEKGLLDFYNQLGFEELKTIPKELKKKKDCLYLVWNKNKTNQDESFSLLPDIVLLDGGKGQLSTTLKNVSFPKKTKVLSIAKKEEIVFEGEMEKDKVKTKELKIEKHSPAHRLITQIRDEAHRFANEHRKTLQKKKLTASVLDEIKGIGPTGRKKLLNTFKSIDGIKKASKSEIEKTIGKKAASELLKKLT